MLHIDTDLIPDSCGVYLFRGKGGKVIYVGKAVNIRSRVRSHLQNRRDRKEIKLTESAETVDWIATGNELEALVLEDTLIKQYKPRFNIRLKDDKSYPYLVITREEFPAVRQVRGLHHELGEHFGPHGDPRSVRRSLRWVRKVFPVRSCRRSMDRPSRPCLEHHLGRCVAPCTGQVSKDEYALIVEGLRGFLSGKDDEVGERLRKEMWEASAATNFEMAALARDLLKGIDRIREGQHIVLMSSRDVDVVRLDEERLAAAVIKVRRGKVIDAVMFDLEGEESINGAAADFISSYYTLARDIPPRIILAPMRIEAPVREELGHFLKAKRGSPLLIRGPRGKEERSMVEMADRNLGLFIGKRESRALKYEAGERLKVVFGLETTPDIVEGFDISHLHGTGTVASMVHFRNGKPLKSHYRKFRIKNAENDDTASMREVVERRYRRILEKGGQLPDIILIDGGKGQLNAALSALSELGLENGPLVVAIAKKEEELYVKGRSSPLGLKRSDPGLKLLQRVRDEAHRFAVAYQRKLRESELDLLLNVQGIGRKRSLELLNTFDSLREMYSEGAEGIAGRTSLSLGTAENVIRFLEEEMRFSKDEVSQGDS